MELFGFGNKVYKLSDCSTVNINVLQGTDITVQYLHPVYMRMRSREVCSLGLHVFPCIFNTLLLELEWAKNVTYKV